MHELGVLRQIVKVVLQAADSNAIERVKHITLDVGTESGFVPYYMKKLFPVAADEIPLLQDTELRIRMVGGSGLVIKDLGY